MGYLTDYKDGYFNRLEDIGEDGKADYITQAVQLGAQGFPFANRLFFPYNTENIAQGLPVKMAYINTINEHGDIPDDGTLPTHS